MPTPPEYRAVLTQEQVEAQAARLGEFLDDLTLMDRVRVLNRALGNVILHTPDRTFRRGCAMAIAEALETWASG